MRFLWITRSSPFDPDDGAVFYSSGLIRALLSTGATGTVVCYGNPPSHEVWPGLTVRGVVPGKLPRLFSLATPLNSDAFRLKSRALSELVESELRTAPDVVFVDYFAMGWIVPQIEAAPGNRPLLVYVSHNYEPAVRPQVAAAEPNPIKRQILVHDAGKAIRLDRRTAQHADLIVAITDADKAAYQKDVPETPIVVATPGYDEPSAEPRPITADLPRRAVISGSFVWVAKLNTLKNFLEAAKTPFTNAGIELVVAGKGEKEAILDLQHRYSFATFTGRVRDVRPYLAQGRIGIMPDTIGGGFKLKYLDYIFNGLAVATIRSQFVGLSLDADRDVLAGDTVEEMVQTIVAHIDDVETLDGMRRRCWNACSQAFRWNDRGVLLRAAIKSCSTQQRG